MRKLVLLLVLGLGAHLSHAQTASVKIGYADVGYIIDQLPEAKAIEAEMKSTQTQLKNQIDAKVADFQKKLADYNANLNTMLDAVRANTERELTQMQQNIEKLQADAQTTIETKQRQLLDPVYKKVGKGIEDVAKENGFTFILSQQIGGMYDVILYGDDKMDISDLVLKKLGVTPKPAPTTPPTQPK
ncbi:MAG TPA: OmpH family outer membrane protein [Chryseolinea sp.]|nr:OmpH family outer membrane protein [Chryseolinea sp.]